MAVVSRKMFVADTFEELVNLPRDSIAYCKQTKTIYYFDATGSIWEAQGTNIWATAAQGARADALSEAYSFPYLPGGVTTFTKMALADTELPDAVSRPLLDLSRFNYFRATCMVGVIGFTTAILRFQYSNNNSLFSDLYSSASLSLGVLGSRDTGWLPLPLAAKLGSVWLRLMGKAGDGHLGPQVGQLVISFKA